MGLNKEEKDVIRATVPILESGGEVLTTHFYAKMMHEYPVVRKYFNQSHQRDKTQPRALARAVLSYAKNIDRLENITGLASEIMAKHAALDILPEHYPIVGKCLLESMVEVLGKDTANDAVIGAWTKAYGQLADLLIAGEKSIYDRNASLPGGWKHTRKFVLARKTRESNDTLSFLLEPADHGPVLEQQPGQYLTLVFDNSDIGACRRNYSVSSTPNGKNYQISVKKIGLVSSFLHGLEEGAELAVLPPCGVFVLDAPHLPDSVALVAAGIGITPLAPMAAVLASSDTPTRVYQYDHTRASHVFASQLTFLDAENDNFNYIDTDQSRPTTAELDSIATAAIDIYVCGPLGFMKTVIDGLHDRDVGPERIHYEFFGSDLGGL